MNETITWHDATRELPDDDTTVLVQTRDKADPIWFGFHDELGWHLVEDAVTPITVTAWADMPSGPIGSKS